MYVSKQSGKMTAFFAKFSKLFFFSPPSIVLFPQIILLSSFFEHFDCSALKPSLGDHCFIFFIFLILNLLDGVYMVLAKYDTSSVSAHFFNIAHIFFGSVGLIKTDIFRKAHVDNSWNIVTKIVMKDKRKEKKKNRIYNKSTDH